MPKRWATWPRSIQWLVGGIAAVVLALAIAWVLFVPAADWLARHDVGSARGPLLQTARDAARGRLLTLGAGLFAAAALVFTAGNFTLSRRTFELTEQGQVTDRYTKAIEQLGSDKLDVRIGGIYALERVARDSARDHPTVMEVLTAFIREHSREQGPSPQMDPTTSAPSIRPDVQAAVTVIRRRDVQRDVQPINLTDTHLSGARLREADLPGADLSGAYLDSANLDSANLVGAQLTGAQLTGAKLTGAQLPGADLTVANLTAAQLAHANLTGAQLTGANLTIAYLVGANLTRANLTRANLTGAFLTGAFLPGADLTDADLTDANLADVQWPSGVPVPPGWTLGDSGRLAPVTT